MPRYIYARALRRPLKEYIEKDKILLMNDSSNLTRLILSTPKFNSSSILNYIPFN